MKKLMLVFVVAVFTMIGCGDEKKEVDATMDAGTDAVVDTVTVDTVYVDTAQDITPDTASPDLSQD